MKKLWLLSIICFWGLMASAQSPASKLQTAFNRLQADSQSRYASISFTVLDCSTAETVFTANPNMALATASTLKTITSITAFNILGADYRYQTDLYYTGSIDGAGVLNGDVVIKGSGDPTLGSPRYAAATENVVLTAWATAINKAGIKKINGRIIGDDSLFGTQAIPDGWIWQDVGNYYGAGTSGLCWRENAYEIKLHTGAPGSAVTISGTVPAMPYLSYHNELLTGEAGTGDQSYAYLPVGSNTVYIRGTYATDKEKKSISVATPDAAFDAAYRLADTLDQLGIAVVKGAASTKTLIEKNEALPQSGKLLYSYYSPRLGQIVYWLNQKSINLYAEQLLKTLALAKGKAVSTANGVKVVQDFWKDKGIDPNALAITDGSGLAPADRVTTPTLARILLSAKKEVWFTQFYDSLPIFNDMKMKSGSINNVLCYAGYQSGKSGKPYCFSIMVNNYNGSSAGIKQKIFAVLDVLKGL